MPTEIQKPSMKDQKRYYLWKEEKSLEEIAAREKAKVSTIQASIDRVNTYRKMVSSEEVDIAVNHMFLRMIDEQESTLRSAMVAEKYEFVGVGNERKSMPVPDHDTRIKAVEVARELAIAIRPKVQSGTQVNIQTNVANGVGNGQSGGLSFEQRLREIRAKRETSQFDSGQPRLLEAPPQLSQAEKIAAEFEEAGIDLDDEDLDELEVDDDEEEDDEATEAE